MDTTFDEFELLDPTSGAAGGGGVLSPRLSTLTGKSLGIIWNGRSPTDQILHAVVDVLRRKYDIKQVVFRGKPYLGNIAPAEIFDEMTANCDAVITGVGD